MKTKFTLTYIALALLALSTLNPQLSTCVAQGTAFTYQGRLNVGGSPASGNYDLRFALYDSASGGSQQGGVLTNTATAVSGGLFTVTLDFGAAVFDGSNRWIEIAARPNGVGAFAAMTPRQPVTAVPYAMRALNGVAGPKGDKGDTGETGPQGPIGLTGAAGPAGAKGDKGDTGLTGAAGPQGPQGPQGIQGVTGSTGATGPQGIQGDIGAAGPTGATGLNWRGAWAAGTAYAVDDSVSLNGASWLAKTASTGSVPAAGNANWDLLADKGATGDPGATGPQGSSGLTGATGATGPQGIQGATGATGEPGIPGVAGPQGAPGSADAWSRVGNAGTDPAVNFLGTTDSQPLELHVNGQRGLRLEYAEAGSIQSVNVIGGYSGNSVSSGVWGATIAGGGDTNDIGLNLISAALGTIGGGAGNTVNGNLGTVAGGDRNTAGFLATVSGGNGNQASSEGAMVPGGESNIASGYDSFAAGTYAHAANQGAFVWGDTQGFGFSSTNNDSFNVQAHGGARFITGGAGMTIDGQNVLTAGSSIPATQLPGGLGGSDSTASGTDYSVVAGGFGNTASGGTATVAGGDVNTAGGDQSAVGGGGGNSASGKNATVAGGLDNSASGIGAFVGGGGYDGFSPAGNTASGNASVVSGGLDNLAGGYDATVPGGFQNTASGAYSFAAGRRAKANHDGAFVWADSTDADFASTANNQFLIRASGGVGIGTTTPAATLEVNGSAQVDGSLTVGGEIKSTGTVGALSFLNRNNQAEIWQWSADSTGVSFRNFGGSGVQPVHVAENGSVGIGTSTPTKALLEVEGNVANVDQGAFEYYNITGTPAHATGSPTGQNYSIWASDRIAASEFNAYSDARIKNIQGQSDGAADLKTLLGIKITDYTYKDTIANGSRSVKKVIAQQVEQVYPQAVSKSTGEVPDIYKLATIKDGWIQLVTDLKVGDRVKLIGEKEQGIYTVLAVGDGAFRTAFKPDAKKVFVYGRQVKDFRSVDYEAIAMLDVSATQELARKLDTQQAENANLQSQVTDLRSQLASLQKAVARLATKSNGSFALNTQPQEAK